MLSYQLALIITKKHQIATKNFGKVRYSFKSVQYFFGRTLKEITPVLVAQFRNKRSAEVQPATVIKDLNLLSHIYTTAIREWSVEAINQVSIIKKPKAPRGRLRFLTSGKIVRLIEESKKGHRLTLYKPASAKSIFQGKF